MTSTNTIKELRFLREGEEHTARDETCTTPGFYRKKATESGYFIRLADSVVFVTERALSEARAAAFVEARPVPIASLVEVRCSTCGLPPGALVPSEGVCPACGTSEVFMALDG